MTLRSRADRESVAATIAPRLILHAAALVPAHRERRREKTIYDVFLAGVGDVMDFRPDQPRHDRDRLRRPHYPYHWCVTGIAFLVAGAAALAAGAAGFLAGRRFPRARTAHAAAGTHAATPGRNATAPGQDATVLAARALAAASAGHLVLDADGELLVANRAARDLALVAGGIPDPRIVKRAIAVAATREAGRAGDAEHTRQIETWEASSEPGRPEVLRLAATPLGDGFVLVTATDETAAHYADTMRRDFVANVSHELKSPVTAIGLLAEAVTEAADSPAAVREFADRMRHESSRLGALITELIALSAIQNGSLGQSERVPMDEVIADAVDQVTIAAEAGDIHVRVDGPIGAEVLGDRSLLTTAVGNLVENAVHYSGAGTTVSVRARVVGSELEIAVADTGIGIAPRDQQRIFERFFRADPARSRATGGTGLGLAIVKHTVTNHGGSIGVDSALGAGSTFTVRLPLAPTAGRKKSKKKRTDAGRMETK